MKYLPILLTLISISIFGYSTQELNDILNSDKTDIVKVKKVLELDESLKKDILKINEFKNKHIKKYKALAISTMKDKTKTNFEKMQAWKTFSIIAEGTKHERSGKIMFNKFSKKALKDLSKDLKTEELEADRNYKKILILLDKILKLNLKDKQIKNFKKKKDVYSRKIKEYTSKTNSLPKSNPPIKTEIKTEIKKQELPQNTKAHTLKNKLMKDFRLPLYNKETIEGGTIDITDYAGSDAVNKKKLILLTFYANYCKPCKKELPFLNTLFKKYKDQGLLVVAVNTDKDKDERKKVKQFIVDNNLSYPVVKDGYGLTSKRYEVESFPTMFLINADGKIIEVTVGYDEDEEKLENKIKSLLK